MNMVSPCQLHAWLAPMFFLFHVCAFPKRLVEDHSLQFLLEERQANFLSIVERYNEHAFEWMMTR